MADAGHILTRGTVLHRQSGFVDHLSCPLQDDSVDSRVGES